MAAPRRLLLALGLLALGTLPLSSAARAFFVFGDSLVDNGNNNYLATTARADTPPYGIDTPSHRATGRFSNGKNVPDIVSTSSTKTHLNEHSGGITSLHSLLLAFELTVPVSLR